MVIRIKNKEINISTFSFINFFIVLFWSKTIIDFSKEATFIELKKLSINLRL